MRAAVNDLQMMVEGRASVRTEDTEAMGRRNQRKELNESLRAMFSSGSLKDARDATLDLDETPDDLEKWIEEAIPIEMKHPEDMAEAFDALSRSDVFLRRTKRFQYYGFWSYARDLMTGGVAVSRKHGPRPSVHEYGFPGHFILLSRSKGRRAVRESVTGKMMGYLHTSRREIGESILPYLSLLVKNDDDMLLNLTRELGLSEEDVGYLIGSEPDSAEVRKLMARASGDDLAARGHGTGNGPSRRQEGRGGF